MKKKFIFEKTININPIKVKHGTIDSLSFIINNKIAYLPDANKIFKKDLNKFKNLELDLPSSLGVRAPISRDQKLDELILLSNGERIQSYDLVAITDVKKKSFISALWDNLIFSVYSFFMQDETT